MKQGTWFKDWLNLGDEPYYHPFSLPEGFDTVNLAEYWLNGEAGNLSFAQAVTLSIRSASSDGHQTNWHPRLCYTVNYGYHLDAGKFAALLTENAVSRLGVTHIEADVTRYTVMMMVTSAR